MQEEIGAPVLIVLRRWRTALSALEQILCPQILMAPKDYFCTSVQPQFSPLELVHSQQIGGARGSLSKGYSHPSLDQIVSPDSMVGERKATIVLAAG